MSGEQKQNVLGGCLAVLAFAVLVNGMVSYGETGRKEKVELEKLRLDAGYTSLALPDGGTATVWLPRIKK